MDLNHAVKKNFAEKWHGNGWMTSIAEETSIMGPSQTMSVSCDGSQLRVAG